MPPEAPVIEEDRPDIEPHVLDDPVEFAFGQDDQLANSVIEAAKKAKGVERLDFGTIFGLIQTVMELLGNCPFARARQALRSGDSTVIAGAFKAARDSGQFTPKEAVAFAINLQARAKVADEAQVDSLLEAAPAFGRRAVLVLMMALLLLPGVAAAQSGPFGSAVKKAETSRDIEIDNLKRTVDALRKDNNVSLNMIEDLKNEVQALRYEIKQRVPKTPDSPAWSDNSGTAWTPDPNRQLRTMHIRTPGGLLYDARERSDGLWNVWNGQQWVIHTLGADNKFYPYGASAPQTAAQPVAPAVRQALVAPSRRG